MNRDRAEKLLNARLDGEIDASDEASLEEFLRQDPSLAESWASLQTLEPNLRRVYRGRSGSGQRLGERVIAQLRTQEPGRPNPPRHLSLLAASAAGFLLACVILIGTRDVDESPTVGEITLSTGTMELKATDESSWSAVGPGSSLPTGAQLRTLATSLSEIIHQNGTVVRLAEDTQVSFTEAGLVVPQGRLWCEVKGSPLRISTPHGEIQGHDVEIDLTCSPEAAVIVVLEGSAEVEGAGGVTTVTGPQRLASLCDGRLGDPKTIDDPILATRWIHEILRRKGGDDPELASRVRSLLGQIEKTPLYEAEIRALGAACAPPLAEFVESPDARQRIDRRRRAAELLADLASFESIPALIGLLDDADGDVRNSATRALQRISGRQFESPATWRDWWQENPARSTKR